jgi:hypothetical protein
MSEIDKTNDTVDWKLTTWDGARREELRRWAQLPLERVIASLEEMQALSEALSATTTESKITYKHKRT